MRAACDVAGVQFMTCFYQRFNARHRHIRELLAAGVIGGRRQRRSFSGRAAARAGAWRQDPSQAGGGCYMDNASHCIDLVRLLLGDIVAIGAFVDTLAADYAVEDTATSILRLASGAQVVITSYWSTGDPWGAQLDPGDPRHGGRDHRHATPRQVLPWPTNRRDRRRRGAARL